MADTDDDKKKLAERNKAIYAFLKMGDLTAAEATQAQQQARANELRKESMQAGAGGWGGVLARGIQGATAAYQQRKADEAMKQLSQQRQARMGEVAKIFGIDDGTGTGPGVAPVAAPSAPQFDPSAGVDPQGGISPLIGGQPQQPMQPMGAPYSGQQDPLTALMKKKNPFENPNDFYQG